MICPQFRPILGGYQRAAERLSTALAETGLRVVVITERRERGWPASELIDGYEIRRLPCWYRRRLHVATSLLSFACFLLRRGREFDVWHVHEYGFHLVLAVILGKALGRPVVLKLMSSGSGGIESAMGQGIVGRTKRYFHRRVSACVAVSEETLEEAVRFSIPSDRVHFIPNGIDGRQFPPAAPNERAAARLKLGLECERMVLCVGRLSAEKNPLGLLDAWAAVDMKARKGALLAFVGDGPEWNQVHARAQAPDLAGTVCLAGRQSDVTVWYRAADLYVIPSHREGLSNSMIEALASGLPVISTRVSGSSVLVEPPPAGLVVDICNPEQLAGAIGSLLRDESMRARLGANARLACELRFSLAHLSEKIISLYGDLLNRTDKRGTT
jgi:glycosyltransferase involved in cell wall biosynthesis